MRLWEYILCAVKTKIMTLFNNFFCFVSVDERSQEKSTATSVRTCVAIYGALRFDQKCLNLCSKDEWRSNGFGTTWGWVINNRIFIFEWIKPLRSIIKKFMFRINVELIHHYMVFVQFFLANMTPIHSVICGLNRKKLFTNQIQLSYMVWNFPFGLTLLG